MRNRDKNEFIFITIGLFLILVVLYNRLIRIRLPRNFEDISFLFSFLMILTSLVLLIMAVNQIYKYLSNNEKKQGFFTRYLKRIHDHPYNPYNFAVSCITELDVIIKNSAPYYNDREKYTDVFLKFLVLNIYNTRIKNIIVIILLYLLPHIIVTVCFMYDIFFSNQFYYFYKTLWLLIFPMISNYLTYSINIFITVNLTSLNDNLDLKVFPTEYLTENTTENDFRPIDVFAWYELLLISKPEDYICYNNLSSNTLETFQDDLVSAKYNLEFCISFLNELFISKNYMFVYENIKLKVILFFNSLKYICYIVGWLYILFI